MFDNFFTENLTVYDVMSRNVVEPERPHMTIWRWVAGWIIKCTRARLCTHTPTIHTHTQAHKYVIFICFPLQQWFHEHASLLRCTHIACLQLWTRITANASEVERIRCWNNIACLNTECNLKCTYIKIQLVPPYRRKLKRTVFYTFSVYRPVNTLRLGFKNQSLNAV